MGQHQELVSKMLERDTREFLEASILAMKSPEEAYRQFNDMSDRHTEGLRRLLKNIQDVKGRPQEVVEAALDAYDDALNALMPCLMAQCNIYWDLQNYHQVMKILRQSEEFCQENPVWQLNMAHAFFLMDEAQAYLNAIKYYQPFVLQAGDSLLSVKENVLANLCVAYIMTTQNEVAEELMRRIEREEENFSYGSDAQQPLHHCIVNLVIGTLYCSKGNFEFGISRVIRSLEPYQKKLEADTWCGHATVASGQAGGGAELKNGKGRGKGPLWLQSPSLACQSLMRDAPDARSFTAAHSTRPDSPSAARSLAAPPQVLRQAVPARSGRVSRKAHALGAGAYPQTCPSLSPKLSVPL